MSFDKLKVTNLFSAMVERMRGFGDELGPHGCFSLEQWRLVNGVYQKISDSPFKNDVTNAGKNHMLGVTFLGGTPNSQWYMGLIDGTDTTPVIAAGDTMSSHAGWAEFTDITQTTRQSWSAVANSGSNQVITNVSAQWTISSGVDPAGRIAGAFICSNNTIGGTTGTLWSAGKFGASVPVQSGDVFKLNYTTGL